jgi:hypothetical protein
MRHPLLHASVAFGVMIAAAAWPSAGEAAQILDWSRESIVVRTYTAAGVDSSMRTARHVAGGILEDAGVDLQWIECQPSAGLQPNVDACAQPVAWNELVVRVVPGPAQFQPVGATNRATEAATLGFAAIDLGTGRGSLATIYGDRVSATAAAAGVDVGELLGRAIAHEIGHLLLGTNRHAARGLMRACWSPSDLRRSPPAEWRFATAEGDLMRKAIASRRPQTS